LSTKEQPVGDQAPSARRYGVIAVFLHWTIAALILLQMALGWYMNEILPDNSPAQDQVQNLHISIGLTTLLLILVRIGVRLAAPPPPTPAGLAPWERLLAGASHLLFYLLMLALPLTGWALVSLDIDPIAWWGIIWPHMPGLSGLTGPDHRPFHHALKAFHTDYLVWTALANLALHVAGALKHQFDGNPVLWRMLPFMKARP
jgi:cytochrome b561